MVYFAVTGCYDLLGSLLHKSSYVFFILSFFHCFIQRGLTVFGWAGQRIQNDFSYPVTYSFQLVPFSLYCIHIRPQRLDFLFKLCLLCPQCLRSMGCDSPNLCSSRWAFLYCSSSSACAVTNRSFVPFQRILLYSSYSKPTWIRFLGNSQSCERSGASVPEKRAVSAASCHDAIPAQT